MTIDLAIFKIKVLLIYNFMKVSHEQYYGFNIHLYYQVLTPTPIAVTTYQHSKMLEPRQWFLRHNNKSTSNQKKIQRNQISSKLNIFMLQTILPRSKKVTHRMGENICKSCNLRRDLYLEYIKNSYNLTNQPNF